ncbi:MAG: alpha/beta hydrolase [Pseudomonadota bacterium]|nr:alpha/beta hydrolase [Pseudomonadota bacterium]
MRTTRFNRPAATAVAATLAAVLLLAGCDSTAPAGDHADRTASRQFGDIAFASCSLPSVAGGQSTTAQCATFEVPENRDAPDGRQIALHIAWLPAGGARGGIGDPVFFLAGGPGQAATEHAASVDTALREVRKQRDIILIDQRGTGDSNPLDCLDADGKPMSTDGLDETSPEALVEFARQCAASLEGRADPRFYTTTEAVQDLDAVRIALGVDRINLVGGSYGTRVAQQYAMRYPQHTRSLVLDGVAPNALVVGGEFAHTLEDALALQSAQCQRLPACQARYPTDMRAQLRKVMLDLQASPVEVEYRDPGTGESRLDTVTADTVTGLAFVFSYAPQTAALLPLVIDEAAHGRYAPLMSLSQLMARSVGEQMTRGMQWSVLCAEDAERFRAPADADTTILGAELAQMFFAPCAVWPRGKRPADFNAPFKSDLPVLLLSGELDPVTPPRYGEQVLQNLPNGRHLVLDGQGHGAMMLGCMPKLIGQFIETVDAKALDVECLDTMTYVPPFTSFNGWEP